MSMTEPTEKPLEKPKLVSDNSLRLPSADLQRFAKTGLDLKIGDFRKMCEQLGARGLDVNDHERQQFAAIADILFDWMTQTLEPDADK